MHKNDGKSIIMGVGNKAQYEISFQKHENHQNLIFIKTIPTSRHMYVFSKSKGIHTHP